MKGEQLTAATQSSKGWPAVSTKRVSYRGSARFNHVFVLILSCQVLLCLWQEVSALSRLFELSFAKILTFEAPNIWENLSVLHNPYVLFSHSRCTRRGVLSLAALLATDTLRAHQCGLSFTAAPKRSPLLCVCINRVYTAISVLRVPELACNVVSHWNVGTTSSQLRDTSPWDKSDLQPNTLHAKVVSPQ